MRNSNISSHGCASYLLTIHTNQKRRLSLYLPEIYSSYECWINGEKYVQNGNPDFEDYAPYIRSRILTFEADGNTEILLSVRNTSHYYSGMYFPPLLSEDILSNFFIPNLLFYAFLCFTSFAFAIYSLSLWLSTRKNPLHIYLFTMACSFAIFISQNLITAIGFRHTGLIFALNDSSYFILLFSLLRINMYLTGTLDSRPARLFMRPLSAAVCILSGLSWLILKDAGYLLLNVYGGIVDVYKLIVMCYVAYTSLLCIRLRKNDYMYIVISNFIYISSVLLTLFFANRFEPLVFGWPNEYCAFLLVACLAVYLIKSNRCMTRENELLNNHLEEEVNRQTLQLRSLLSQRKTILSEVAHDMKAPLSSLESFAELVRTENVQVDEETAYYLDIIRKKSEEARKQLKLLGLLADGQYNPDFEKLNLNDFLFRQYQYFKPDTDASAIALTYHPYAEPLEILGNPTALERVFCNILYNALSYTPNEGFIAIILMKKESSAVIEIRDNGSGIEEKYLDSIFDKHFSLRTTAGEERGLGLYIARTIVEEHNGNIYAGSKPNKGTRIFVELPLIKEI